MSMQSQRPTGGSRLIPVVSVLILFAALGFWFYASKRPKPQHAEAQATSTAEEVRHAHESQPQTAPAPSSTPTSTTPETAIPSLVAQPQRSAHPPASPEMRELVNRLAIDLSKGPLTAE